MFCWSWWYGERRCLQRLKGKQWEGRGAREAYEGCAPKGAVRSTEPKASPQYADRKPLRLGFCAGGKAQRARPNLNSYIYL